MTDRMSVLLHLHDHGVKIAGAVQADGRVLDLRAVSFSAWATLSNSIGVRIGQRLALMCLKFQVAHIKLSR